MIRIGTQKGAVELEAEPGDLGPRDESQLAFWGFTPQRVAHRFVASADRLSSTLPKLTAYFDGKAIEYELDGHLQALMGRHRQGVQSLAAAMSKGIDFKNGVLSQPPAEDFKTFVRRSLARPLKDHQLKAALHLLAVENGANFSVPGSGKTSVVLAVFEWLRQAGTVRTLFVVGPPSCFGPWRHEYLAVLGRRPKVEILAGGDIDARRDRYRVDSRNAPDMFLTTFQTLQNDSESVRLFLSQSDLPVMLVVDEAHYVKQIGGLWASAVLSIAPLAARRCILTGTPFPRTYSDAFNLFDLIWPSPSPLCTDDRHRIVVHSQRQHWDSAAEVLERCIGPLFYRVRKSDLGLAPQVFHPPIVVPMARYERLVYDSILDRIRGLSKSDYFRNLDLLMRLRRGRMVRLRQCLSSASLLATAVTEYSEDLLEGDLSLSDVITHYAALERPAKMTALASLVHRITQAGEKVLIWSNFVRTLEAIRDEFQIQGIGTRLIYGETPFEKSDGSEEQTREDIIAEFLDPDGPVRILVANPAACAESISLHTACWNAIYYDLSYNCAQYLQSLDRIHRVGGSERRSPHYYFLQYADTLDADILVNVRRKADNMTQVIDRDYPICSLDMFEDDDEVEAYTRLFESAHKSL